MQQPELKRIIDQLERLYSKNWTGVDINKVFNEIDDDTAEIKESRVSMSYNYSVFMRILRYWISYFVSAVKI